MAHIELEDVSVSFRAQLGRVTLKEYLLGRSSGRASDPTLEVAALQGVSLRVGEGQRLGILGHNGAGKSTLLKVLAGIYPPTSGRRSVEGRISSLFDIALGFEPEANGWENIAYRGYLQGETPRSIRAKAQTIADYSELGTFLDMPVRHYSAGMRVRLAFAIATAIDPEILLVDEVLSVGDRAFQQKARRRMREMLDRAKLIVLVSHDLDSLRKLCDRGLWLDHGRVRGEGPMSEVIRNYCEAVRLEQPKPGAVLQGKSVVGNGKASNHGAAGDGPAPRPSVERDWGPVARWRQQGDLRGYEWRVYSQNGEDGILQEVLRRVGVGSKKFAEFTCAVGYGYNCLRLALEDGWSGLFVEPVSERCQRLEEHCRDRASVRCVCERVSSANVEGLLENQGVPQDLDVLSIVLAGNDYWVWSAVRQWRPRVVVVEYNATHLPPKRWVMREDVNYSFDGTSYFGASLASLAALAEHKGYTLVGTNSTGVNAFFVRDDLAPPGRFPAPDVEYHYSPLLVAELPPGDGPFVEI